MPLTFAHPAIILPLKHLPKRWYSLTGLIAGSMTPDFEYFIRMQVKSNYSHTLSGLFWFDVPLGILLSYVYLVLVRDGFIDNLPRFLNSRFSKYQYLPLNISLLSVAVMACSVFIGSASHLFWDGFTHPKGYFVQHFPALTKTMSLGGHRVFIYKILQHGSTFIGFAAIAAVIIPMPKNEAVRTHTIGKYWVIVVLSIVLITIIRLSIGLKLHQIGNLLVTVIAGGLIGLIVVSLILIKNTRINVR
ncbi:DUF4184 family protein [Mucilaginibacter ginsenosidivorax]|uniref:DUF4184 family protein n=1 Tax=Mucilaginibacter ginsenosidivorax TaxID=862126 RepID=A0A5B8W3B6_9SPHI|nr:DUF4184 family protein [Mucilaginibacter ginsenosidivorax]QEC78271.1 DUF4184 family protein [Mucilaginibacter ginsenosidivorax]